MIKNSHLIPHISRCLPVFAALSAGFGAGVVNGLLGTGGGILLLLILRSRLAPRDAFASSIACILPLSVLSLLLYLRNGTVSVTDICSSDTLPYLLGASPGGIGGAYLLDRMKPTAAEVLFAALLIFSGWRMAFS